MIPGTVVRFVHPHVAGELIGTIESVIGDHARVRWDLIGPSTARLDRLEIA